MIDVVAALFQKDGAYLVFRRPRHKARGGCFEFVGGKVEPGETHREALIRECREELSAEVSVGDLFYDVTHVYPDIAIHLYLYRAEVRADEIRLLEHEEMLWVKPDEFDLLPFCPADDEILRVIRQRAIHKKGIDE
ncbi:MAG: (deoxy)nucleoside triphosphate pyrophosphohydrolase [Clostridia bacterium]|nr:(deoxy)nucleoside triphosphate pyrophosphohydrolase [Clostridia bacterium]